MAQDDAKVGSYFIPSIGNAPSWIPFLDNITEELELKSSQVSEDLKFVTKTDLEQLNANHLIGTSMLKSHLHGYFMPVKVYNKLVSVADPFAYEKYRDKQI